MNSAHNVSNPVSPDKPTSYNFAIDRGKLAAELRKLADLMDSKEVFVESAIIYSRADCEDFTKSALVLKYHEKVPTVRGTEESCVPAGEKSIGAPIPVAVNT